MNKADESLIALEAAVLGLLKAFGYHKFAIALKIASAHGAFDPTLSQDQLDQWFKGIDLLTSVE